MLFGRLSADLADQKRTGHCGAPHTWPRNKVYWRGLDVVWSKCPGKLSRRQPILKRILKRITGVDTNDELTDADRELSNTVPAIRISVSTALSVKSASHLKGTPIATTLTLAPERLNDTRIHLCDW